MTGRREIGPRSRQIFARDQKHIALGLQSMLTGFGRTGTMWGGEHEGIAPGPMPVGKGMGGDSP